MKTLNRKYLKPKGIVDSSQEPSSFDPRTLGASPGPAASEDEGSRRFGERSHRVLRSHAYVEGRVLSLLFCIKGTETLTEGPKILYLIYIQTYFCERSTDFGHFG